MHRPDLVGAVLVTLAAALVAASCSGDGAALPPTPTATAAAPSTGSDDPPTRDPIDLARRFGALADPPRQLQLPPPTVGADLQFEVLIIPADPDERPERRTVAATLRAVSEHAYFFVERGASEDEEVEDAVRAFEEEVWPKVTGAFGPPAIPGIDGDPRLAILHADLGPAVGGYVSGADAYPRAVAPDSNQREMVYLNLTAIPPGSSGYARLLAHELQHVVHQRLDRDEEAWVNEGLSEVAAGLVGEEPDSYGAFLDQPDTQLDTWSDGPASGAHYGASSLFFAYLLEQTGGDARGLAAEPGDGIEGVKAFLRRTGARRTFEEVVADWAVANYLDRPEGPYGYREREVSAPSTTVIEETGPQEAEVRQFAADYLELRAEDFPGEVVFRFEGEENVRVLAAQAGGAGSDGGAGGFWWSNRGDNIDTTLTRELDLTGVRRATLTFRTWFDIERWYDFAYVVVSRDGGHTWQALSGRRTTTDDPLGVSLGPGYSGHSGGGDRPRWVEERIDLSPFAGARLLLRFEYVADDGLNRAGWAIDDIAVPEVDFFDDAATDVGGWRREGFQRVLAPLPQRFRLRLIKLGPAPEVEEVSLDGENRARVPLTGLGADYETAVVVIMGATEGTTEPGGYRFEVTTAPGRARGAKGGP